jgi:hypothetical protein
MAGLVLTGIILLLVAALIVSFWWVPGGFDRSARVVDVEVGEGGEGGVFTARRDRQIDRLSVRRIRDGLIYAVEDHFLYVSDDMGETFERRGAIPKWEPTALDRLKNAVARHPLSRRLREVRGPGDIVVLGSGTILMVYDRIYRSEDGGWTFEALPRPVEDFFPPLTHGTTVDAQDRVFFGDYRGDPRPHAIRVFRGTQDGAEWEVCHTFELGQVFHVHAVSYDPFADQVLVSTGDQDEESWLFRLDPECGGVEPIGGGSQTWRSISPVFLPDAILWGTDNDWYASEIIRYDRATEAVTAHLEIGKPSYHATVLADGTVAVSTTYEPRSVFTREQSPETTTEVWISRDETSWHLLDTYDWKWEEDRSGMPRAMAQLPRSDGSVPYLFVTLLATVEGFVTYRYSIDWQPE